ncbi:MAG TPA: flavodoxin family protein [Bacteroidales bacterium]|nr:flavodoxin family protein [Bacteroidales bacterium]
MMLTQKNLSRLFRLTLALLLSLPATSQINVLVAYYSRDGHTRSLAEAVARGAESVDGVSVKLLTVDMVEKQDLLDANAIIVGSPVYNANVTPQVSEFLASWPFDGAPLKDKIGAAFATGGGISAGEELTQLSILHSMLIFGMIIVGGPDASQPFGTSAITYEPPFSPKGEGKIDEQFIRKGENLGKRVAEVATMLKP